MLVHVVGDRLGDALLRLPVVRGLRSAFPDHRIVWLAGRRPSAYKGPLRPLVDGCLDEVRDCAGIGPRPLRALAGRPLRGERHDVVIDTQQGLLTALYLRRIDHDLFVSPAAGFRLSARRPPPGTPRPRSVAERLRQLVELAAGRALVPDPRVPLPPEFERAASALLPAGPVYVGLAPGAGGARKRWPLARYLELGAALAASGRVPAYFLGPEDAALREHIAAAVPAARFPELEHPGGGPLLAIALARRLAAAVANDAGPAHLLAAAGIPVITLFGRTDPGKFADAPNRIPVCAAAFGGQDVGYIPLAAVAAALERVLAAHRA